ncbi:hypothetical protein R1sor_012508 [Riccia sorocarpa]|uniref:Uncharacterized protein n=1 Tax=Riccia sorocarpa TaxID=122646 RepID=A0ABD3I3Y8_9MARC
MTVMQANGPASQAAAAVRAQPITMEWLCSVAVLWASNCLITKAIGWNCDRPPDAGFCMKKLSNNGIHTFIGLKDQA